MTKGKRIIPILWAVATLALATVPGCGGDGGSEQGLLVSVFGPPAAIFPDLNPFANCDLVKICYDVDDGKTQDCTVVSYVDKEAVLESLPFDKLVSVSVECLKVDMDTVTGEQRQIPVSRGQSCSVKRGKGDAIKTGYVYMLPSPSFGPTFNLAQGDQASKPGGERWGSTIVEMFDGSVLIAGGAGISGTCEDWADPSCVEDMLDTAEIYNPANGSFTAVSNAGGTAGSAFMSEKRAFAAAVVLPSEEIAIFGGLTDGNQASGSVDIYDPISNTFRAAPAMTNTRAYHTATLINREGNGEVLLVGGYGTGFQNWEIWSPVTGTVQTGGLTSPRWNHTATLVDKTVDPGANREVVLIAGGEGGPEGTVNVSGTMDVFDLQFRAMDPTAKFLCSNDGANSKTKTMHGAAFVPLRHFLYIVGGFNDAGHLNPTSEICVYHTSQETWAGTLQLRKARGALSATALDGNVVLFAGGLTRSSGVLKPTSTVEILFEYQNTAGETVVDIGPADDYPIPMLYPRWGHEAMVGCDGKVFFVGGLGGESSSSANVEARTELFNPDES